MHFLSFKNCSHYFCFLIGYFISTTINFCICLDFDYQSQRGNDEQQQQSNPYSIGTSNNLGNSKFLNADGGSNPSNFVYDQPSFVSNSNPNQQIGPVFPNYTYPHPSISQSKQSNIEIKVQLRSYSNPGFRIGQNQLCTCPQSNMQCINTSPQRSGYNCLLSFTILISSADTQLQYGTTSFMPLDPYGKIKSEYINELKKDFRFQLTNQPHSIVVLVFNLGAVIGAQTGNLEHTNTVTQVDQFTKELYEDSSSIFGGEQHAKLVGNQLGTQLELSYSVLCRDNLIGPGCDLLCNSSAANSGTAVCQSQRTGYFNLCRWTNGKAQVTDCKNCPWGIRENSYCMDETGGVLEANHAGVVSTKFRTATIILAFVCTFLVFCLLGSLVLIIILSLKRRSKRSRADNVTHESTQFLTSGRERTPMNKSIPPLISSINNEKLPPPYVCVDARMDDPVTRSRTGTPLPQTNNLRQSIHPHANSKFGKPALQPTYQPLPSIANPNAFEDSLNTSYSSALHPPSKTADV